jgi:hypothetical protein
MNRRKKKTRGKIHDDVSLKNNKIVLHLPRPSPGPAQRASEEEGEGRKEE